MGKTKILFVGSFKKQSKSGHVGGQMFACNSLINSDLSKNIDWLLIDSTADSNMPAPIYKRTYKALKRFLLFLNYILFYKIDKILIFSADGFSFVEKGMMGIVGKLARKFVIFSPRSGIVVRDVENSKFMKWWISFVISKVDIVICQGDVWKKFYGNLISKDYKKLIVIQNWLDIDIYKILLKENNRSKINVGFLSWVDRNKGIFELIEAAHLLKYKYPNVKYIIGGKGNDLGKAKKLVAKYDIQNQFDFKGWVLGENKIKFFKDTDIYVLPSYFEGFPNSLMEAMASQISCIATKVGSIPDLIEHKKNGLLIEPMDVNDLKSKLKMLIDDNELRQKMAANARQTIVENNTIKVAVNKFKILLEE